VTAWIGAPRLRPAGGQLLQGDLFAAVPLPRPEPDGTATTEAGPALLLTPTCDFAVRAGEPVRQLVPVEPLAAADPRPARWGTGPVPWHLHPLPPEPIALPHGGVAHFRRTAPLHPDRLAACHRVATLDAAGLRAFLAAHATYHTRARFDPAQLPIGPDDPRLLWAVVDAARAEPSLVARRPLLERALATAVEALAAHHGLARPSPEAALVRLLRLAEAGLLPDASREAALDLDALRNTILGLYRDDPKGLAGRADEITLVADRLERLAAILQEPHPHQITEAEVRRAGLGNLLR
jgi:hypothetical protein